MKLRFAAGVYAVAATLLFATGAVAQEKTFELRL
jgi:hypothetical protein